jgi:hypothetical protein
VDVHLGKVALKAGRRNTGVIPAAFTFAGRINIESALTGVEIGLRPAQDTPKGGVRAMTDEFWRFLAVTVTVVVPTALAYAKMRKAGQRRRPKRAKCRTKTRARRQPPRV